MNNQFMFVLAIYVFAQMFSMMMEGRTGFAGTVLTADITSTSTTIPVVSTAAFLSSNFIILGDEDILYSSATATTFTVATNGRGFNDTDAAAHKEGDTVYDEAPGVLNRLITTQKHEVECAAVDVFCWIKGKFKVVGVAGSWITAIPQILAFDYSYLDGLGIYIKLMFYVLSAGLVFSFFRMILGR